MSKTHTLFAIATTALALHFFDPGLTFFETLPTLVASAGASLLPDLDHPDSTSTHSASVISETLSALVCSITTHRHATHSFLALALFSLAVFFIPPIAIPFLIYILAYVGLRSYFPSLRSLLFALPFFALAHFLPVSHLVVVSAVGLGYASHLASDALTVGGVALLYPLKKMSALPLLGHTQSVREHIFRFFLLASLLAYLVSFSGAFTLLSSFHISQFLPKI